MKLKKFLLGILAIIVISTATFFVMKELKQNGGRQSQSVFSTTSTISSTPSTQVDGVGNVKKYTNTEFGFEFEYPEDWFFYPNTFYSPFSKFNLVGAPLGIEYQLVNPILINIVTPDFADRAIISRQSRGAVESSIAAGGVLGKRFEDIEPAPRISIDLQFGEYRMILAAYKEYESALNQILTSFKFLR